MGPEAAGLPAGMLARVFLGAFRPLSPLRACALILLATLCLAGTAGPALAAGSIEGGSSFNELSRQAQEPEATTSTATEKTTETGAKETKNSSKTLLIGFAAAVVLILGIAVVIMRDAKRHSPTGELDPAELEARVNRDLALRQRKRRAKAKAARQQRKRNARGR